MSRIDIYDSKMYVFISSIDGMYHGAHWEMSVDLYYLVNHAGIRGDGHIPINKAKKILRLIYLYTDHEDKKEISEYLKRFPKLNKIWKGLP